MAEYFVIDRTTLRAHGEERKPSTAADAKRQEETLRGYFTQLAKKEKLEDKVIVKAATTTIGTAAPMLRVTTDEETAQKLQTASQGRLSLAKVGYR